MLQMNGFAYVSHIMGQSTTLYRYANKRILLYFFENYLAILQLFQKRKYFIQQPFIFIKKYALKFTIKKAHGRISVGFKTIICLFIHYLVIFISHPITIKLETNVLHAIVYYFTPRILFIVIQWKDLVF